MAMIGSYWYAPEGFHPAVRVIENRSSDGLYYWPNWTESTAQLALERADETIEIAYNKGNGTLSLADWNVLRIGQ